MTHFYDSISDDLATWISEQHMFFVGSAPLSEEGHVNLSPKGQDAFRVLSPNKVTYLDMTGSGNETSAHIKENGRITFMFCSYEKAPRILRLYGTGRVVLSSDTEWDELSQHFTIHSGTRQFIVADIHKVQTSCGFAVPFMEYVGERNTLIKYWDKKGGESSAAAYHVESNQHSIDGLPTHFCAD
jgi:pyridoxamine 5'-phosphate oxidase-like protein